ncbi:MAG: bifunctional oligoribonuclease/PAP phosphatase NrnA [Candidatus Neomarinimicrobiota bacterium]|nr:bifunctional oligoribonuclease/PAP phosphatase NrnA [Candidatus Neomarinimicrobiota bacterium]
MLDWKKLNQKILSSSRIVLSTHQNPDGDGLGSASAMYHYIKSLEKDCKIIHISDFPNQYDFLNQNNIIETYNESDHNEWMQTAGLALIFDIGDYHRLGILGDILNKNNIYTINIDHHPDRNDGRFNDSYINIDAAATGEMVYDFLIDNNINLNQLMAQGIYTAVMTDTGSFRHNNTNQKSHKIAMDCIDYGVDNSKIYQSIYENRSKAQVSLLAKVIDNLRYDSDGQIASFIISREMIESSGAIPQDIDGFTDFVRTIKGVEISIMIYESDSNRCRINFRSKGKYKINDVAKSFGGGGHKFAAGAIADGTSEIILQQVVDQTKDAMINQHGVSS